MKPDVAGLDLGALRTLKLVYRLGSFSRAAASLEVKQSTVSYTVDRLRRALNDPLFVRIGKGIAPTDRCVSIIQQIDAILAQAEVMAEPEDFELRDYSGQITIACSSVMKSILLPQVVRRFSKEAPNVTTSILVGPYDIVGLLIESKADIVLVTGVTPESSGVYVDEGIFVDRAVCLMATDHPLAGKVLTVEDLENHKHIELQMWQNYRGTYVTAAEKRNIRIMRGAILNDPGNLDDFLKGTHFLTGVPSAFAKRFGDRVATAEFPFELSLSLNMAWAATSHRSRLNAWARAIIKEEAARLLD